MIAPRPEKVMRLHMNTPAAARQVVALSGKYWYNLGGKEGAYLADLGTLAVCLRWARSEQGLTLQQLSERSSRAISYLWQLENGVKGNPTRQTVLALATALGVRPAFLFGEVPRPPYDTGARQRLHSRAQRLSLAFSAHWESLGLVQRQDLALAPPESRFRLLARFLLEHFSTEFTSAEIAWQLGMSFAQWQGILAGDVELSLLYLQQMAVLTGLPLHFLTHGQLSTAPPPAPQRDDGYRYVQAVRLAMARRVSPARLEELIRMAARG